MRTSSPAAILRMCLGDRFYLNAGQRDDEGSSYSCFKHEQLLRLVRYIPVLYCAHASERYIPVLMLPNNTL
eukprot:2160344-Pleurochrysis_carterae.AAC.1